MPYWYDSFDARSGLRELDRLSVFVLVDNEADIRSSPSPSCQGGAHEVSYTSVVDPARVARRGASAEARLPEAAHGLSLLCVAECDGDRSGVLFDTGPAPELLERNVRRLGAEVDLALVEAVVLSHWDGHHSGGLRAATSLVACARARAGRPEVVVDLPSAIRSPLAAAMDPGQLGGSVNMGGPAHVICSGLFYVSGVVQAPGAEERYLACRIKGAGTVVLSACSHAGIVNICQDAASRLGHDMCAVIGGLHLSGGGVAEEVELVRRTVEGLKRMQPDVVLAGHCTGWRAKAALSQSFGGAFQPLAVGGQYVFSPPPLWSLVCRL